MAPRGGIGQVLGALSWRRQPSNIKDQSLEGETLAADSTTPLLQHQTQASSSNTASMSMTYDGTGTLDKRSDFASASASGVKGPHEIVPEYSVGEVQDEQQFKVSESRKIGVTGAVFLILNKMIGTGSECAPCLLYLPTLTSH